MWLGGDVVVGVVGGEEDGRWRARADDESMNSEWSE